MLSSGNKGIWAWSALLPATNPVNQLTLGEGNTPELVLPSLIVKREDTNPTGSLKDRGMAYLISYCKANAIPSLVLSSSGNAAISVSSYAKLAGISVTVFVSPHTDPGKLALIKKTASQIIVSARPVSSAFRYAQTNHLLLLRPSKMPAGPIGFQTLAWELAQSHPDLTDVFLPVSSGVAFLGLAAGFQKIGKHPRLHVCQTSQIHPIAGHFDTDFVPEAKSLATAIVAKTTPLTRQLVTLVKDTAGSGWVITNLEITEAQDYLKSHAITTSNEGAVALAGYLKAKKAKLPLTRPIIILTGKSYANT